MYKRQLSKNIVLCYAEGDEETSEITGRTADEAVQVVQATWGLGCEEPCRIYVLGSLASCVFHATPWYLWLTQLLSFPIWFPRLVKMRKWAAGFALRYKRPAIFMETPAVIADKSQQSVIGKALNELETDPVKKFQRCLVHEMTHAFSAHLRLAPWLNEGLAMVAVDRFTGKQTIRSGSLEILRGRAGPCKYSYQRLHKAAPDEIIYLYARAYWVTRYLSETRPELLPSLLKKKRGARNLEKLIARALGLTRRAFWRDINERVLEYFAENTPA